MIDLPGGDLHVTDRGPRDAPTILLVHCYTCAIDYPIMDSASQTKYVNLPLTAKLARMPVLGPALKRVAPDSTIHKELSKAFHEGFDFPDSFVDEVKAMTFTSFAESFEGGRDFTASERLDDRIAATGLPVTVI